MYKYKCTILSTRIKCVSDTNGWLFCGKQSRPLHFFCGNMWLAHSSRLINGIIEYFIKSKLSRKCFVHR